MDLQGLTPVDTLYEYAGHVLGLRLSEYLLWGGYFFWFVIAGAVLRLYYKGVREGSFVELGIYPVYVMVILILVSPIEVALGAPEPTDGTAASGLKRSVQVPRVLAIVSAITDRLQTSLIGDLKDVTGSSMREWERLAALAEKSRVQSPELRADLEAYAKYCYWPALVRDERPPGEPWDLVPLAGLPVDAWLLEKYPAMDLVARVPRGGIQDCSRLHAVLESSFAAELESSAFHRTAKNAYLRAAESSGGGADPAVYYSRRVLYNEIYAGGHGEMAAVREALPAYSVLDAEGGLSMTHMSTSFSSDSSTWGMLKNVVTNLPAVAISLASAVAEWWAQRAMGPATYYRVSALAPYLYGMVIAVLFMLFPLVALMAFWPGWWTAIVNFMKLFLSVKLWPVLWAFLSGILSSRNVFTGNDPSGFEGGFGGAGILPAIATMYLAVPALSFMIVNLAHQAGGGMLSGMIGQAAGASIFQGMSFGSLAYSGGRALGNSAASAGKAAWNKLKER